MTSLSMGLADAVRRLRAAAGYSQEAFAAKAGLHRTFMGAVERGKTNVSLETLERIAGALELHVWQLLRCAETEGETYSKVAEP